jgi:hypothetical protein
MNINTKINMLYDFIYSKTKSHGMTDFDIEEDKIKLDDIKIKFEGENYDEMLDELFSGKFKMIDFNKNTNNLILKKYNDNLSVSVYITPYNVDDNMEDLNNMNNNDSLFSYILSSLVLSKKTHHIALPIINIDVKFSQMHDIIKPYNDYYKHFMEMIKDNQISNILSVRIKESFFKTMQLSEFINSSSINIKKLLFQIIHTLAVLQKKYPGFRHNMLNLSNIFVYLKKHENTVYEFNHNKYYVPDNNFEIKITNFLVSNIPNMFGFNPDGPLNVPFFDDKNDYFDLHYFLNNLLKHYEGTFDEKTAEFLDEIIPEKYRNTKELYLSENDEHIIPEELLDNKYFKEFKKEIKIERTMAPDNYYTNIHSKYSKNNSNNERKNSISGVRKLSKNEKNMKGGATFYHPPIKKPANTPFISNDSRNVYRREIKKEETKEDKPKVDDDLIMVQEIRRNPNYVKPFKVKEKPTHDPEHKQLPKPHYVPQAQVHYSPKKDTETKSNDETISSSSESDSELKETNSTEKYERKERKEKKDGYNKPNYHDKFERKERFERQDRSFSPERQDRPNYERKERFEKPSGPQPPRYQPSINEAPVLAEQKVYQPSALQNFPPGVLHTHPKYTNPAFVSIDNQMTYPPAFVPDMANYFPFRGVPLNKPNELPLQKVYNINLGAPGYNHTILNQLYQNVLPGEPNVYTMNNVYEREQIISMLRTSMIKHHDGEDMTIQAGPKSMMEYIKVLEFNPYALGRNRYSRIPLNFLLYNGAYPIRYNNDNRTIEIAKQSMGINIRIYMLSVGALNCNSDRDLNSEKFDVWRELRYYNYIKETILKQKISPNFITMLLYKLDRVSKINYQELEKVITDYKEYDEILRNINNYKDINNYINVNNKDLYRLLGGKQAQGTTISQPIDVSADSKVSLICLTEAPTYNLIEWGCPTYEKTGSLVKQLTTGFHTTEVWRSVLFQLLSAMAVLQEKQIYFRNFSFENNVFIKDLFKDPNNIGHWIYKVNNIEMYVPNFGHLVLIDSRFADVNPPTGIIGVRKIVSPTLFKDNGTFMTFNMMNDLKTILSRDNFMPGNKYNDYGMVQPDNTILDLLDKIIDVSKRNTRIKDMLVECFPEYIHNRVGTLLNITEKTGVSATILPKLVPGKMVAYQSRYDEYMWALYLGDVDGGKKKEIYIKENNILVKKSVFNHSLVEHPDSNNIIQITEKNFRLNKDSLIDSYNLDI